MELRCNKNTNTSYKTKACFSFVKEGYCPYGHRCNYIHQALTVGKGRAKIFDNFPELIMQVGTSTGSRLIAQLYGMHTY
jgi:hypothetical protein